MVGRDIEGFEIIEIRLDLRPFVDTETDVAEDPFDGLKDGGDRVQAAALDGAPGKRDVDRFGLELLRFFPLGERFSQIADGRFDATFS
jgi:hypothetical protein